MASNLSPSELVKYEWRVERFMQKYKAREPFQLVSGQKVFLVYEESKYNTIGRKRPAELLRLEFVDANSKTRKYKLSSFKKTVEFGGKPEGGGSGVGIEMREINSINKQLDEIRSTTGERFVPIKLNGKVYPVARCDKTPGVPKSDFSIFDANDQEIMWISHKEGSTAKHFQQWGGMTEPEIQSHPEAQEFIRQVQEKFPDGIPPAMTVAKSIKDPQLKNMSIYGVAYGKGKPENRQNVSLVIQGPIKIRKLGSTWHMVGNHTHENGEKITGEFEPVMMAIYKGDRSNFGVKGARFAIQPRGSRPVKEWIE